MKTLKTIMALAIILLMAVQPDDIVLWGIVLATCAGIYSAAERGEQSEKRTGKKNI